MDVDTKVSDFFQQYPLRTYPKHELLLQAEEPINSVFYIVKGQVSQYDIAPNGNEVVINVFKPKAFFPMSSAINAAKNYYFFEAGLTTQTYVAPASDAVDFLKTNPDVMFNLLSRVYRGMDGVLRRMAHLMGGNAESRLIFELLNAAYRFGEQQSNGKVRLPLTEGDIAKRSGLARETVSRSLQALKSRGLIETNRSGISIISPHALEIELGTHL